MSHKFLPDTVITLNAVAGTTSPGYPDLMLYEVVTRVAAIVSITVMAITEDLEGFHNNDIFYAGVIAVIVIGPHALDRLAGGESNTAQKAAAAANLLVPVFGIGAALFRFLMP